MTEFTQEEIARLVQESLKRHQREGWNIIVVFEGIHRDIDGWYVPVHPGKEARRTIHYYDILAEVETELGDQHDLDLMLVPTAPSEEEEYEQAKQQQEQQQQQL